MHIIIWRVKLLAHGDEDDYRHTSMLARILVGTVTQQIVWGNTSVIMLARRKLDRAF